MSNVLELPVRPKRVLMHKRGANGLVDLGGREARVEEVDHNIRHAPFELLVRVRHEHYVPIRNRATLDTSFVWIK